MALDFPNSPAIGDEFTGGGFTWVWTGSSWDKVMASVASGGNGFTLVVGSLGNTTYAFNNPQPMGSYSIESKLGDTTFDIYLVTASNQNAGYANTFSIEATAEFNRVVIYGAMPDDVLNFEFKPTSSPNSSGEIDDGAAPFLTSANPITLAALDDTTTVTGGNFANDVEIVFTGQDGVDRTAKSIVRSSSTSLIVTRPDVFPVEQEPYSMTATNAGIADPSTGVNILTNYFLAAPPTVDYLVIAGGGGGAASWTSDIRGGGGGGAGGYRTSAGTSGGGTSAQPALVLSTGVAYEVTVGAGGVGGVDRGNVGTNGNDSVFATITSIGGGRGGVQTFAALSGGSGGGDGNGSAPGAGTAGQGFSGGQASTAGSTTGAGGGGAGGAGADQVAVTSIAAGGAGVSSSITGSAVTRALGGSSGSAENTSNPPVNSGNGGPGTSSTFGRAGGSGLVVLRYYATFSAELSAGLVADPPITIGVNKVTVIKSGTGTVVFS